MEGRYNNAEVSRYRCTSIQKKQATSGDTSRGSNVPSALASAPCIKDIIEVCMSSAGCRLLASIFPFTHLHSLFSFTLAYPVRCRLSNPVKGKSTLSSPHCKSTSIHTERPYNTSHRTAITTMNWRPGRTCLSQFTYSLSIPYPASWLHPLQSLINVVFIEPHAGAWGFFDGHFEINQSLWRSV